MVLFICFYFILFYTEWRLIENEIKTYKYWSGRAADMIGTELVDTVSVSADFKTVLSTGSRLIVVVSLSANELVSCNNKQGKCGLFGKMN